MQNEWPLVARTGELRRFREMLTDGESRGMLLAGAPGVGKTRFATECLREAERGGLATARVSATRSSTGLPFGALASLLPADHHGEGTGVDDRADLLHRYAAVLMERAGGRRLVLFVDDSHLLDDASATLIHLVVTTRAAFVLTTLLDSEAAPDAVVALWKDGLIERVELAGLGEEAIEELLAFALGGPVDRATVTHLAHSCQGNVLFLRELVLGALEDGTLSDDTGRWRVIGPFSPSKRLVALVEARLRGLRTAERALLELVSFGEPIGPAELAELPDAASAAELLERAGLLVSSRDGRRVEVRLAHSLYGDVLRARIPALRVRAIAGSLADAVERTGARRRQDILRVATWRLEGGEARPELMLAAATTARWRYDFDLAERLARAAVQAGAGFDAALLAAQLAALRGRGPEAETELAELAPRAADDAQRALVALTRLDNLALYMGRIDEGLRVAEKVEATIAEQLWRDEITARRSGVLLATRGPRAAATAAEPLLQRAEGRALAWACLAASCSLGRLGRLEAALDAATKGHAAQLALTRPLDWYPWMHIFFRGDALAYAGRLEDAEALATGQYDEGLAAGSTEMQAFFTWQLARVTVDRGHVQTGARHARETVALFRQLGRPQIAQLGLVHLALALALGGHAEDATDTLAAHDAIESPSPVFTQMDLFQARAWTAVATGDLPRARLLLEEAVVQGESTGDLVGEAAALHTLARLGYSKDATVRLTALTSEIEGDLIQARAAHARALVAGDAEDLLRISSALETMGADLLAAEAAADAAVVFRRAGDTRAALTAGRRAGLLVELCEGAITPALQAVETRAQLTPAERRVALLAAGGHPNREIADQLSLSVRTVENHLQRVYEKLGVTGRAQLAKTFDVARDGRAAH